MADQYKPINCEIHDGYELACMRRASHQVIWSDELGNVNSEQLRFLDLKCRDGKEYLIAELSSGQKIEIRLDQISSSLPY